MLPVSRFATDEVRSGWSSRATHLREGTCTSAVEGRQNLKNWSKSALRSWNSSVTPDSASQHRLSIVTTRWPLVRSSAMRSSASRSTKVTDHDSETKFLAATGQSQRPRQRQRQIRTETVHACIRSPESGRWAFRLSLLARRTAQSDWSNESL